MASFARCSATVGRQPDSLGYCASDFGLGGGAQHESDRNLVAVGRWRRAFDNSDKGCPTVVVDWRKPTWRQLVARCAWCRLAA